MADRAKTADLLEKLQIGVIDADWVKYVWDGDFGDFEALPEDVEANFEANHYHVNTLKGILKVLLPWAQGKETSKGEGLWSVLVEQDLPYKTIVALLAYFLDIGQKRIANGNLKEVSVVSAGIYFTLLKIPGSGAFKIFHPMLFEKAVKTFKIWTALGAPKRKRPSTSPVRASQTSRGNKSRKRSKDTAPTRSQDDPFAGDEEEEEEESVLSQAEINRLQLDLIQLLRNFVHLLSSYSLRDCEQSAYVSLETLAELSKLEAETFNNKDLDNDTDIFQMKTIPQLAYKGLLLMCSVNHGETGAMVTAVFKHLLPSLLMLMGDNKGVAANNIPRYILHSKEHAVAFVCLLVRTLAKESVMPALRVMLQHMCAKVPDKSEYRAKVAQSVVVLMREMTGQGYAKMVEWLYKYSRNAKISWRGFALDIVSMLLSEPERTEDDVPEELQVFLSHHFLLQMLLSRCSDVAPTVRSRGISTFAQCLASKEPFISSVVRDVMTPHVVGGRGPVTRVIPTPNNPQKVAPPSERSTDGESIDIAAVTTENQTDAEGSVDARRSLPTLRSPFVRLLMANTMVTPEAHGNHADSQSSTTPAAMVTVQLTPGLEITLSDAKGVTSMLRRRAGDEKVNVRKSALQAIEGIIQMMGDELNKEDLNTIEERCRDPALSVRKQALLSLTSLLMEQPHHNMIQMAWLNGCLPMVLDRESSAQEKCLDIMEEVLLNNIVPHHRSKDSYHQMAWELLNIVAKGGQAELRRYLTKSCQLWSKKGNLKAALISSLKSHVNTDNNSGAWMLLAEMAPFAPKFETDFVVEYWQENARSAPEAEFSTVERVLTIITNVAKNIPAEVCSQLSGDMKDRLMQFNSPPELTSVTVNALNKLCLAQTDDKRAVKKLTDQWFGDLLTACDNYLSKVILNENQDEPVDESGIIRHLFTVGEMAQLCPSKTPKRVFMLVQSLIAAPVISQESTIHMASFGSSTLGTELQTSSGSDHMPSTQLQGTQTSQGSQPFSQGSQDVLSQFRGSKMSGRVRAHAFLTLGKLCLQNQDLAKKCVAALARELEVSPDPTVRNNVVVIMADLCVRYTTLVDRYVPNISSCVKDSSPLVRKQCLTLLTRLLQEDFLKWKGSLFYHFVTALVDDIKEISDFAEFCLVHLLMQRHPGMFYHHFIECIFFFNNYDGHSVYNKFTQTDREKKQFSLKGKNNSEKRLRIYRFLLEHMADDHRFQLTAKLCQDILAAVVDGVLPLDVDTSGLLQDTLFILSSKEIKLSTMRNRPQDEIAETEQEMAAVVMNVAKKTLITQVVKKNVMENVVPTVIGLKHILEKNRSPVLQDLMKFLRELMKDYKTEVKDILAADRQLANEIEFDLRKFEEKQEEERQARENQNTPQNQNIPRVARQVTPQGSPTSPRHRVSPRAPASPAPHVGSPRAPPGTPRQVQTPIPGCNVATPARQLPMSTMAVINSARKAMEKAKKIQPKGQSPRPDQAKRVGFVEDEESSHNTSMDTFKTPDRPRQRVAAKTRAISTPSANLTMGNITFLQGDHNLSMIPASPIPTPIPLRLYPQGPPTPSWTTRTVQDENGQPVQENVIAMFSPDKPLPKTKRWNVKTTPRNIGKLSDDPETPKPVPEATQTPPSRGQRRTRKEPMDSRSNTDNQLANATREHNKSGGEVPSTRATRSSTPRTAKAKEKDENISTRTRRKSSKTSTN